MSKYTTEVRYICESYAGLTESVGYDDVDSVIEKAIPKIFKSAQIPMYAGETEEHRALLLKKILLHYYTREIGYETVGLWKLKLNTKLMEIMPYYNQLYESAEIKYNPLHNVDVTKTHEGEYVDDETGNIVDNEVDHTVGNETTDTDVTLRHSMTTEHGDDSRTNVINSDQSTWNLMSDTPQGGINGIVNGSNGSLSDNTYLTEGTHIINTPAGETVTETHGDITQTYNKGGDRKDSTNSRTVVESTTTKDRTEDETRNKNGTDEYENKDVGKIGELTYQEMILKYRETFLNIDLMVIDELDELFMGLW